MLGFIKKDLLLIKNNLKTFAVILIVYAFMSFSKSFDMSFILPLFAVMLFISTFSYDDYNNWNAYAVTLPNGRKNVVRGKYLSSLILILISALLGFIITIISSKITGNLKIDETVSALVGCIVSVIIIASVMFPLIFKYGSEKGRIYLFLLVFGITLLGGILSQIINIEAFFNNLEKLGNIWLIIIPIFSIIILTISYSISSKIYLKKEF